MKKNIRLLIQFAVLILLLLRISWLGAQHTVNDLQANRYFDAVQNIVELSGNTISREAVEAYLNNPSSEPVYYQPDELLLIDFIYIDPLYRLVAADGNETAEFKYFYFYPQAVPSSIYLDFSNSPEWINQTSSFVNPADSTINIAVYPNTEPVARSGSFTLVINFFDIDTLKSTAFVIQEPAPEPFIFVTPTFLAITPEGGTTSPLTVTHFDLTDGWEAIITDEWLEVDSASLSPNAISFIVEPNNQDDSRQAEIELRAVGDHTVNAFITLFQYGVTQSYLFVSPNNNYIGPEGGSIVVNVQTNLESWGSEIVLNPDEMISGLDQNIAEGTLSISVDANMSGGQRAGKIIISGGDPLLSEEINIFQTGAYILLFPSQKVISCEGGTFGVQVIASGVEGLNVSGTPDWITTATISNDSLLVSVSENQSGTSRLATITVSSADNSTIADSLLIMQYACSQAYILLSPDEQVAAWNETTLTNPFTIFSNNVEEFGLSVSATWLEASVSGNYLNVILEPNVSGEVRAAEITVFDSSNPSVQDIVSVIQLSTSTYIYISPAFQLAPASGGTIPPFNVITSNVESWEVHFDETPAWITNIQVVGNSVVFSLAANPTDEAREATFRVRDVIDHNRFAEASILQQAATSPYLLLSPRSKLIAHTGNPAVNFQVTAVNVENWVTDLGTLPSWITVNTSGQEVLSLNVAENTLPETRTAMIRIHDVSDPTISDSVFIYQHSAGESYLLVSPTGQLVGFEGNANVQFQVTAVNLNGWQYDPATLPSDWITVTNSGGTVLSLNVAANTTQQTRQATIRIFATGQPDIEAFVSVYQQAAPSAYLLASPRIKTVSHLGDSAVDFSITMVNIDGWEFVSTEPYEDWITFTNLGDSIARLAVAENTLAQTRFAEIVIQALNEESIRDTVYLYQHSSSESYLLLAPREQTISYSGGTLEFHVQAVNVNNWLLNAATLPSWITPGNNTTDTLRLNIGFNATQSTRMAVVHIEDEANPAVTDSVAIYQLASSEPLILIAPRSKQVGHTGSPAVDFDVTLVHVNAWEFSDTTAYSDWIDFFNIGESILRLAIDTNHTLQTRSATIVIQSVDDPEVTDSVKLFQFSALDRYIIAEPREQMAKPYANDTLDFNLLMVNVDQPAFEVFYFTDSDMIDLENSFITENLLKIFANPNETGIPREARIRIFDQDFPEVADTVYIYQGFASIILSPASLDGISWAETIFKINTFTNISEFTVSKGHPFNWYQLSQDALSWSDDPIILRGNDSLYVRVLTNSSAFAARSSFLGFEIGGETANEFWFSQNARPGLTFAVSGGVFINGDESQPLAGVEVFIYDTVKITDASGIFMHENVPENWVGTITPLIDLSLPFPYYFLPPAIEITAPGITGHTYVGNFSAFNIQPSLSITPKTTTICNGETLAPGDAGYPAISLNNTYGTNIYQWTSEPFDSDSVLEQNANILRPVFGPTTTTTYWLKVENLSDSAVDYFTIVVNPLPNQAEIEGPRIVCRNQAGAVYQVANPQPGVSYTWRLEASDPGGMITNGYNPMYVAGNIAVVDWGEASGIYILSLTAYNQWLCATEPQVIFVEINESEASPATTVLRKRDDNMLFTTDTLALSYQWGWFTKSPSGQLEDEYLIPGKNQWYCRFPDGHIFDPMKYYYFVITYHDSDETCISRSFYNAPVLVEEIASETPVISPNPGNGVFTIQTGNLLNNQGGMLEVYNIHGKLIWQSALNGSVSDYRVDLVKEGLASRGLYIVVLRTTSGSYSSKLIVQ